MSFVKLYNIDASKLLGTLGETSVDLILIDPPYVISRDTGFKNSKGENTIDRFKMSYQFGDWDKKESQINMYDYLRESYRVLKPNGTIIVFYDIWKISYLKETLEELRYKQIRFIEWVKTNPVPINSKINYLTNSREIALTATKKNKPTFNSKYDNGIYEFPIYHSSDRIHPTQKNLSLFEELIRKHSNEGDIVVDFFLGSGTTAIACLKNNRNFIGCEIEKEYFDKMVSRVQNNVSKESELSIVEKS